MIAFHEAERPTTSAPPPPPLPRTPDPRERLRRSLVEALAQARAVLGTRRPSRRATTVVRAKQLVSEPPLPLTRGAGRRELLGSMVRWSIDGYYGS